MNNEDYPDDFTIARPSLTERLRTVLPPEKVLQVAVIFQAELLHQEAELRLRLVGSNADVDSPDPARWWTRKHAKSVAKCSMRTLERRVEDGTIRVNRRHSRSVLICAEDVLRWCGLSHLAQRVA